MKPRNLLPISLSALFLTGCLSVNVASRRPPPPPIANYPIPPVPLAPGDAATLSEIDAAARLSFDSSRQEALGRIAQRAALNPAVQVHLVNVTYRCMSFDSSKMAILKTVISNPSFCDSARQAIVTQLENLSFDSSRQAILRDLNQRVTNG